MALSSYSEAIYEAFDYLLGTYPDVFVLGQGLWSPWYVGKTMDSLDKKYGVDRLIDTPVSESAVTAAAIGAAVSGMRPIVVHPRMDFMMYAMDSIVNQASKWSHMFGGQSFAPITIRSIVNRYGEQGAQHSQSLHSLFCHLPGLRVVMPSTVADARDLLISSVLCNDPVLYIDDRLLYSQKASLPPVAEIQLATVRPQILQHGTDITVVGIGVSTMLVQQALNTSDVEIPSCEVIDLRILNPLDPSLIIKSVLKTRRLLVVDEAWRTCGMSGELIASVSESVPPSTFLAAPRRLTLPDSPAPCSRELERIYYTSPQDILSAILELLV